MSRCHLIHLLLKSLDKRCLSLTSLTQVLYQHNSINLYGVDYANESKNRIRHDLFWPCSVWLLCLCQSFFVFPQRLKNVLWLSYLSQICSSAYSKLAQLLYFFGSVCFCRILSPEHCKGSLILSLPPWVYLPINVSDPKRSCCNSHSSRSFMFFVKL